MRQAARRYALAFDKSFSGCLLLMLLLAELGVYTPSKDNDAAQWVGLIFCFGTAIYWRNRLPRWQLQRQGYTAMQIQHAQRLYETIFHRVKARYWLFAFALYLLLLSVLLGLTERYQLNTTLLDFIREQKIMTTYLVAIVFRCLAAYYALSPHKRKHKTHSQKTA